MRLKEDQQQRKLHKTRKFFSSISTFDLWAGAFRSTRDSISNSSDAIKNSFNQVKAEQTRGQLVDESFETAMSRLNLDEFKLMVRYQQLRFSAIAMLLVLLGSIGLGGYFLATSQWLGAIGSVGAIAIGFAYTLSHCFRAWQIRFRHLGKLSYFMRRPNQWWPRSVARV